MKNILRRGASYKSDESGEKKKCTGCFKKSFTVLKADINIFRGHVQCFELS
jgi:hypothetical protein